jgi:hypothetical protein
MKKYIIIGSILAVIAAIYYYYYTGISIVGVDRLNGSIDVQHKGRTTIVKPGYGFSSKGIDIKVGMNKAIKINDGEEIDFDNIILGKRLNPLF